jgi:hypothetical protein
VTVVAPAGTLLLVMTNGVHRGCPIRAGRRYAMFNYYYPRYQVNDRMRAHFVPRIWPASTEIR